MMFSATIPAWVGEMARAMMEEPLSVTVGDVSVCVGGGVSVCGGG